MNASIALGPDALEFEPYGSLSAPHTTGHAAQRLDRICRHGRAHAETNIATQKFEYRPAGSALTRLLELSGAEGTRTPDPPYCQPGGCPECCAVSCRGGPRNPDHC